MVQYTILETNWGYFGLLGSEMGVLRTHLPGSQAQQIKKRLLAELEGVRYDKWLFGPLQKQIIAYFKGSYITFDRGVAVDFSKVSAFTQQVLTAARNIRLGQTISYGLLAEKVDCGGGGRAIGNAMGKNPLPLIIPCHRVIRSDGKAGGFSPAGGIGLKEKMLGHEKKIIANR